jgi:hypothetical protein
MNYFECTKCGMSYVYAGNKIPSMCGALVGFSEGAGGSTALGCAGKIVQISKEQADAKVEKLRS